MLKNKNFEEVEADNDSKQAELFGRWISLQWMSLICKMKMRLLEYGKRLSRDRLGEIEFPWLDFNSLPLPHIFLKPA